MISWKYVLNANNGWHGTIDNFFNNVVIPSGYDFFWWNGVIYSVVKINNKGMSMKVHEYFYVESQIEEDELKG